MMKKKLFILFPGGFKPIHCGHIMLAENAYKNMSQEYDTEIYFIVSPKDRGDIAAKSTVDFLNGICKKAPYMHVVETVECSSPIRYAYILTQTKVMGDGCYCMLASTKDTDIKRARDFFKAFDTFGKYHTDGVEPILMENVSIPLEFTSRTDEFQYTPISSSVLRMDIANNDFESFFDGYRLLVEMRWIDDMDVKAYFNDLRACMGVSIEESILMYHLNEGGLGGHIMHPYEVNNMQFTELFDLICNLMAGKVQDITEKVDGMNLFASVDLDGEPIFARNLSHIRKAPFRLKDMIGMWSDRKNVSNAFIEGSRAVSEVFSHISNPIKFFNTVDINGNLILRKWVNFEVVNPENVNVINYGEKMILIHSIKQAIYNNPDGIIFDRQNYSKEMEQKDKTVLGDAIAISNYNNTHMMLTPNVVLEKQANAAEEAEEILNDITDVISEYGISQLQTIGDYKIAAMMRFFNTRKEFKNIDSAVLTELAKRWVYEAGPNLIWFKQQVDSNTYNIIREFEKNNLTALKNKITRPLEIVIAKAGNKILKQAKNTLTSKNKDNITDNIKKRIVSTIDKAEKMNDQQKDKLEQLLAKINSLDNTVNAIEGIVIEYKGSLLKITGSFGIINQILNLGYNLE